jgi:hypothetical protein
MALYFGQWTIVAVPAAGVSWFVSAPCEDYTSASFTPSAPVVASPKRHSAE